MPARVAALVAASLLLGSAAHVGSSGAFPRLGPMLVTAALVAMLVSASIGSGRRIARRVGGIRGARVEDAAALAALVLGQALVHVSAAATPLSGVGTGQPHGHAAMAHAGHGLTAAAGHEGTWGMLAGHAMAALVVGLLLRSLERGVLALVALSAAIARMARTWWGPSAPCEVRPFADLPRLLPPRAALAWRPRPQVGLGPLARRGPPMALA